MFKFNNRNARKRCEIFSKLTIKLPEPCQWRRFGVFIVNFEHILHLFLVFFIVDLKKKVQRGNEKKKHTNEFRNTNREATPSKYRPQLWISTFIKFLDAIISRRY